MPLFDSLFPSGTANPYSGTKVSVPASSAAAGNPGDWAEDNFYLYHYEDSEPKWWRISKGEF